ncbi:PEP-CTERM putative exosortase interaction domain-containing protein [Leptolyngbya sp. PCC 7375]|nr:PEP-CTERM putative exosortase interaction domain-containing protein [Leptolyngbya sp. PCC 7375]
MNQFNIRAAVGMAVIVSAVGAAPTYAFTLTGASASFDNARLVNGKTVGRAANNSDFADYEQAAFTKDSDNYVEFFDYNGVNQVRWGDPVYDYYSYSKTQEAGHRKISDYGSYRTSSGYQYYGSHKDRTAQKSGLGFAGVSDVDLGVGEIFNLGTLKHYNNTIWSDGRIAEKTDFSLKLGFGDTGLGEQTFNFALNVDETSNNPNNHAGGQCPYQTTGSGCSDKITWDFAIDSESSFEFEGEEYTLELVGFNDTPNFDAGGVTDFISQENGTSQASLFARIVKVDDPDNPDEPTAVPEPGALLGIGALGLLLHNTRRRQKETTIAEA